MKRAGRASKNSAQSSSLIGHSAFLLDVGWPWTSDKAMISCSICGLGMFVFIKDMFKKNVKPAHPFCVTDN